MFEIMQTFRWKLFDISTLLNVFLKYTFRNLRYILFKYIIFLFPFAKKDSSYRASNKGRAVRRNRKVEAAYKSQTPPSLPLSIIFYFTIDFCSTVVTHV